MNTDPKVVYEFGPFRMDPDKQVLLRDGQLIAVTPKAFETLLVLVRREREVVSKGELLKQVWPDSFVEESNLSQNIFMLRKALGDSAENRQYIVTLPGRGYRFAASVRTVTEQAETLVAQARTRTQIVIEENEAGTDHVLKTLPIQQKPGARGKFLLSMACVAVLLALGALLLLRSRVPANLSEKDSILVADFVNTTGDPVFDDTLRQGLSVELEQTPFLQLVSEDQIGQTLRLMEKSPDARLTPGVAREACWRANATADIEGSIAALGNQYVIGLNAVDCRSGETLAREQVSASGKERVLTALGGAASKLRAKLGESRASLETFDTPLEQATTPSLEALRAYTLGRRAIDGGDMVQAPSFFRQAIRYDPNFAMAYARLGTSYKNMGEPGLGNENTRQAYQLRERVSEPEKLYIDSHFDQLVTGNLERALQVFELWAQTYPRDRSPRINLGVVYQALGQHDKSLEEFRETLGRHPSALVYTDVAYSYLYLNRLEDARSTVKQAQANRFDSPNQHLLLYQLAFLRRDRAGLTEEEAWAAGQPGVEDMLLSSQADTAAYYGRLGEARNLSRLAVASAERAERRELAAAYEANAALREALFGNPAEARERSAAALSLSNNRYVEFETALALASVGDGARAQQLANDLDKRFPEDTIVNCNYLPSLRALLALNNKDSYRAVEIVRTAAPCELSVMEPNPRPAVLYPAYVRGEAYLAAHQGREAAVEFQKILDHSGIVLNGPIGALAHVGLARAYAIDDDSPKARASYQDFLATWKGADPDVPILIRAKAEYAKLQ
jgi:DNA-binding winged helix-turn-helix (wHTH) protein/tetratricopeptide (TPR) repeat protein